MLLTLAMLWGALLPAALAEEVPTTDRPAEDYEHLTVGSTTHLSGRFFTDMWGNNTSDIDVRKLLFAYSPVIWDNAEGKFVADHSVVSGLLVTDDNATGNRTFEFYLQEDLRYSDGTPITAWDYAFSWLLRFHPAIAQLGANASSLNEIVGAAAYQARETDVLSGVNVLSEHAFTVTVDGRYLPFFYEMGLLIVEPYPISVLAPGCTVEQRTDTAGNRLGVTLSGDMSAEKWQDILFNEETGYMSHPTVVSGPYTLTSYDGETAEFALNPNYKGNRDGEVPTISTLTYTFVTNETMMDELSQGNVRLLNKCTSAAALQKGMELTGEDGFAVSNYTRTGLSYIAFCCEKPTVSEAEVRKAIACCLDKDALTMAYVSSYGTRVDGYYGIGQWMVQMINGTLAAPVEEPAEGATAAEEKAYEEELAQWEALSLDGLTTYELDTDAANKLLKDAGWTLNASGGRFSGKKGEVRAKKVDGELVTLDLTLICPEGNTMADHLSGSFAETLASVGIHLTVETLPMQELLKKYYREEERNCDMFYLASNFDILFDPSASFACADGQPGSTNATALCDEDLYSAALDMRKTEPGDTLDYCQKWLTFQEAFAQSLPMIPVYSNVYFDFYTSMLQNYLISENITWSEAVVGAYLSDAPDAESTEEDEGEEEFFD